MDPAPNSDLHDLQRGTQPPCGHQQFASAVFLKPLSKPPWAPWAVLTLGPSLRDQPGMFPGTLRGGPWPDVHLDLDVPVWLYQPWGMLTLPSPCLPHLTGHQAVLGWQHLTP